MYSFENVNAWQEAREMTLRAVSREYARERR